MDPTAPSAGLKGTSDVGVSNPEQEHPPFMDPAAAHLRNATTTPTNLSACAAVAAEEADGRRAGRDHTCAAHSVHILLVVVGRVIVDDQDQLLDIQAAGSHARGNEQAADVRLEVVDGGLSVALVLAAMQ